MTLAPEPEATEGFPFAPWQVAIEAAAEKLSGHVRHAALHAYDHIRGAWRLRQIDPSMATFRAITAEEEAATSLMMALKTRHYPGAEYLRPYNHVHKSAFTPLVEAIRRIFDTSKLPPPKVTISTSGPPRVSIAVDIAAIAGRDEAMWAIPDNPLNFSIKSGTVDATSIHLFEEELRTIAEGSGLKSFEGYAKKEANDRNLLLYASSTGRPKVSTPDGFFVERARRSSFLVGLAIAIMQTDDLQIFAIQCLEALLRGLKRIERLGYDFESAEPDASGQLLTVERLNDGPASLKLTRYVNLTSSRVATLMRPWLSELPRPQVHSSITFEKTPRSGD